MKNQNKSQNKSKKPKVVTLSVSNPVKYTDAKGEELTSWKRCGVAWQHKAGMSVKLDTLPINGELWISEFQENNDEHENDDSEE